MSSFWNETTFNETAVNASGSFEDLLLKLLIREWQQRNPGKEFSPDLIPTLDLSAFTKDRFFVRNVILVICYSLIIAVSFFGNLLVVYVIFKRKKMRTYTNFLMANLALSDLLMTVITVPFTVARIILDDWPFGLVMCQGLPLFQVTSVYVSSFTMIAIATDRYKAIVRPIAHYTERRKKQVIFINVSVWLLAIVFSLPNAVFNELVEVQSYRTYVRCRAVYPQPTQVYRQVITIFSFITQTVVPLTFTIVAYALIAYHIFKSGSNIESENPRHQQRRKTVIMFSIVVIVFAVSWTPLNVVHILMDFHLIKPTYNSPGFFVCHWLAMSSVCYNPFIYFWLNVNYQTEFKKLICCLSRNRSLASTGSHIRAEMPRVGSSTNFSQVESRV